MKDLVVSLDLIYESKIYTFYNLFDRKKLSEKVCVIVLKYRGEKKNCKSMLLRALM